VHFDTDFSSDTSITHQGEADFESTATLSAEANPNTKQGTATLVSTATVSAIGLRLLTATANLSTEFATSTTATRTRTSDSAVNGEFAQTSMVGVRKQFAIDSLALFAPTITVTAILRPQVFLETEFAHSTSAVKTARAQAQADTASTITATLTGTVRTTAAVQGEFTQNTQILRLRQAEIAVNSTVALTATVGLRQSATAQFAAEFTKDTVASRTRAVAVTVDTQFTVTAENDTIRSSGTAMSVEGTVNCTGIRIQTAAAALHSAGTQITVIRKFSGIAVSLDAQFAQSSTVNFTVDNPLGFDALFTPTVTAVATVDPGADLSCAITLSAVIGSIKQFNNTAAGVQFRNNSEYLVYNALPVNDDNVYAGQIVSFWLRKTAETEVSESGDSENTGFIWNSFAPGARSSGININFNHVKYQPGTTDLDLLWTSATQSQPTSAVQFTHPNLILRDGEWHHYAIVVTQWRGAFPGNFASTAYRDGVAQSSSSSTGPSTYNHSTEWYEDNRIGFQSRLSLAQLWIGTLYVPEGLPFGQPGTTTPSSAERLQLLESFYDGGYVNLGTGVVNGFTPIVYDEFAFGLSDSITANAPTANFTSDVPLRGTQGRFRLTGTVTGVFLYIIDITASFTMSADVNVIGGAVSDSAAQSLMVTAGSGVFGCTADIHSAFNTNMVALNLRGFDSALTAVAAIETQAGFFETAGANITGAFTVDAAIDSIPPTRGEANLASQFAVDCVAQSFTDSITLTVSAATLACEAELIPPTRGEAALEAVFALSVTIGTIEQFVSTKSSQFSLNCDANTFKGFILTTLSATVALSVQGDRIRTVTATLPTIATNISLVDVINIDQFRLLEIEAETRVLKILPESRVLTIEQETRINTIKGTP
jgi:hypothetical protein